MRASARSYWMASLIREARGGVRSAGVRPLLLDGVSHPGAQRRSTLELVCISVRPLRGRARVPNLLLNWKKAPRGMDIHTQRLRASTKMAIFCSL